MMATDEGLFPTEETEVRRLAAGDRVNVRCSWGDEVGVVRRIHHDRDGFPMVDVDLEKMPVRVLVSTAAVSHA